MAAEALKSFGGLRSMLRRAAVGPCGFMLAGKNDGNRPRTTRVTLSASFAERSVLPRIIRACMMIR